MVIYKITNKINGKAYIGQTMQPLKARWRFHVSAASLCLALKSAINKYEKSNSRPRPEGFSQVMSAVKDSIKVRVYCVTNDTNYESSSEASKKTGINPGHIQRMLSGTLRSSKGYVFKKA